MDKSEVCTYKNNIQISSFFMFQITECGRRGNQVTSVVVADGVENVAIKDVSKKLEWYDHPYFKLHSLCFFSTHGQLQ